MPLRIKILFLTLACACLILLTGCWDKREPDDLAFVVSLGVDKGTQNAVKMTALVIVPSKIYSQSAGSSGSGQAGGKGSFENITVEAQTISSGIRLMNTFIGRELSLKHLKSLVFSESVAREGLGPYVDFMSRNEELRDSVIISVVRKNEAGIFLRQLLPLLESSPSKYIELTTLANRYSAYFPSRATIGEFAKDCKSYDTQPIAVLVGMEHSSSNSSQSSGGQSSGGQSSGPSEPSPSTQPSGSSQQSGSAQPSPSKQPSPSTQPSGSSQQSQSSGQSDEQPGGGQSSAQVPYQKPYKDDIPETNTNEGEYIAGEIPKAGGVPRDLMGTAIFDGDKMVGEFDGIETAVMLMLRDDFRRMTLSVEDPLQKGMYVVVTLLREHAPKIKATRNGDKFDVKADIYIEGSFVTVQSGTNYEDQKNMRKLEAHVSSVINSVAKSIIDTAQKQYHSDVFSFGGNARRTCLTKPKWEALNWKKIFSTNVKVSVETHFVIRRTGATNRTDPIIDSQGNETHGNKD